MYAKWYLILAGLLVLGTGCYENPLNPKNTPESKETHGEANQWFGLSILRQLDREVAADENILISPVSIHTAMNMAANGAEGETLDQILTALHMGEWDMNEVNERHYIWEKILTDADGHPEVLIANGFFTDPDRIRANEEFEAVLSEYYSANVSRHNFEDPVAVNHINGWVEEHTEGKIDQIIENIQSHEIAFLINALYFRSDWLNAFSTDITRDRSFNLPGGSAIEIPFMTSDRNYNFVQTEEYTAVDLLFKDETFSLTLALPSNGKSLSAFIGNLDPDFMDKMYGEMENKRAIAYIPRMELSYKNNLAKTLEQIGIKDAFNQGKADFSRMGTPLIGPRIFITRVDHKTVLSIDEHGAEGAAVTSIGFGATSAPPVLMFDQPFVLMLRHVETNSLLFAGRVVNPVE